VNNFTKVNGTRVHSTTSTSAPAATATTTTPKRTKISNASKIVKATKTPVQRTKATAKGGKRNNERSSLSGSVDAVKTPAMLGERDENAALARERELQIQQTQRLEYFQKQNAHKVTTATTTERNMQKKRSRVHAVVRDENGDIEGYDEEEEEDFLPSSRRRVLFEDEDMPSPTPIGAMSPGTEAAMLAHVMATSPSSMTLGGALSDLPHSPLAAAFAMVNDLLDSPRLARRELIEGVGGGHNTGWDF
jgi:hypothetical protein